MFDEIFTKSVSHLPPLVNSIIRASIEKGSPHQAFRLYKAFLLSSHFRPDACTISLVLGACNAISDFNASAAAHVRILKSGFLSRSSIVTSLFRVYLHHDLLAEAKPLLDELFGKNCDPVHGNLMIMKLLKKGQFKDAHTVFKKMPLRDLVSWNSMIGGCVKSARPREAISMFERMVGSGFEPDGYSFSSVLSACARVGARSYGERVHQLMVEKGIQLNYVLSSALVDMHAKCGNIDAAKEVFDTITRDHVSVWNSMITGLAIHGLGTETVRLFFRMEHEGLKPDGVTFLGVLTACSHCGMVEDAREYFKVMQGRHGIEPRIEHYGALVDALSRAGMLDEAYDTIRAMPIEPDVVIWRVLLSACKKHHWPHLGELAIGHMARLGSGDYVLLSSIYSSARKWSYVENVWETMKENKIRKKRGLSWVELGGRLHQFKAGDRTHPETDDIYRVLNGLVRRVKLEGFVPLTELVTMDVTEEEREQNLNCHSEKLAVAYSVLKTGPGTEIRVSKNLQTCEDCHQWIKVVSKILGRVIIVRDRIRFHRFEKGDCSCKDYW